MQNRFALLPELLSLSVSTRLRLQNRLALLLVSSRKRYARPARGPSRDPHRREPLPCCIVRRLRQHPL
ncbi:protein of unknown function [Shinella sp. WSC3-e]|nr:hypothetical protein SHINE37_40667 [Rhizobiaceae bacterium]CAK7255339.1 protein of unknown function [Shinella sp. WSC3-e]